jgi:serine/threonine protein kinase
MSGDLALPRGARVQDLVVENVIGVGGFGIVYRVRDTALDRSAALKEYLPAALAQRNADGQIVPRSPAHEEHFRLGMRSFVNEARLLASLDHAALLKVWRFWPANGTAYMLMPFYEGITLRKWLEALGAPPREDWLRHLARELIDAVGILHGRDILHRDIAPDNVLLLHGDERVAPVHQLPRPLLLDFGSARHVVAEATQNLTAFLKSGYSPFEQYGGTLSQGPWTDVYSLCAVLYTAVADKPPLSAVARSVKDTLVPATELGRGHYTHTLLAAIDAGLALRPEHRPQTMAALRARLDEGFAPTMMVLRPKAPPRAAAAAPDPAPAVAAPVAPRRAAPAPAPADGPDWRLLALAGAAALVVLLAVAAWWLG